MNTACPNIPKCRLYPQFRQQSFLRIWQLNYCEGKYASCERFKLSTAGNPVPDSMLPNGQDMAVRAAATPAKTDKGT